MNSKNVRKQIGDETKVEERVKRKRTSHSVPIPQRSVLRSCGDFQRVERELRCDDFGAVTHQVVVHAPYNSESENSAKQKQANKKQKQKTTQKTSTHETRFSCIPNEIDQTRAAVSVEEAMMYSSFCAKSSDMIVFSAPVKLT
jgi:hypothetical protein